MTIEEVLCNEEIMKGIRTRSSFLAKKFAISADDLQQSGILALMEYLSAHPNAEFEQVMKVINYKYSDWYDKFIVRKKHTVEAFSLENLPEDFASYGSEDEILDRIDMERTNSKMEEGESVDKLAIVALTKECKDIREIKDVLGITKAEMYREMDGIDEEDY